MTQDEIIEMAREAGFRVRDGSIRTMHSSGAWVEVNEEVQKLIELAAAKEREACARIPAGQWTNVAEKMYGIECAAAIRARGQKEAA